MTKIKFDCGGCGRLTANAKLIKLPHSTKRLCKRCRLSELSRRNKPTLPEIVSSNTNILENKKKLIRRAKFGIDNLTRDEVVFLNQKRKHDPFKSGKKSCVELNYLKNKLRENNIHKRSKVYNEIKSIEQNKIDKKEKNDKFLELLK